MRSLTANNAKTKFGEMLISVQREPIEIVKNGTPVAVVVSSEEYSRIEDLKMELVKARFSDINDDYLVDDDTFFKDLESGNYD